jgi:AraC-like DNA-binding protein
MPKPAQNISRYLPPDRQSRRWGWRLLDAGRQVVGPGSAYPVPGHPLAYLFDETGRRTLDEFQIVYLSDGMGTFESASVKERRVAAGDCFLTFPGEWHRYRPDPSTGWSEYWLGFRGQDAERVMGSFFDPREAVLHPVWTTEILNLFERLLYWVRHPETGVEHIMASHTPMILAFLQARSSATRKGWQKNVQLVMDAKSRILRNPSGRTDLQDLAASLGVSYSKLRALFKSQTGYSPREFEIKIKLNRASEMLQSGKYSVSETSEELGYSSVYYFSRAFKQQFGQPPREWARTSH